MNSQYACTVLVLVTVLGVSGRSAATQPVTFQGQLREAGTPVDGLVDLELALFDAAESGNQVGTTVVLSDVAVVNGLFSVELDFGAAAFNGGDRWLEINVASPAGVGAFTTLSPRQRVTAAPFALQTRGLYVDDAENIGVGTETPTHRLDVAGHAGFDGTVHLREPGGASANMQFDLTGGYEIFRDDTGAGSDGTRFWLDAPDQGEVVLGPRTGADFLANTRFRSDTVSFESTAGGAGTLKIANGNVGVGTTDPLNLLHVGRGDEADIRLGLNPQLILDRDIANQKVRIQITGTGYNGNILQLGRDDQNHDIAMMGDVGVGTNSPSSKLHVSGGNGSVNLRLEADTNNAGEGDQPSLTMAQDGGLVVANMGFFDASNNFSIRSNDPNGPSNIILEPDGNVGIGTTQPQGKVHIEGGSDTATASGGFLVTGDPDGLNLSMDNNEIMARNGGAAADLYVQNDGGDVLFALNGDGYVGIKEASPQAPLHVGGAARFDGPVTIPTTTRYLTIGPPAFHPDSSTTVVRSGGTPVIKRNHLAPDINCEALANVSLPHGAIVTELRVRVTDVSTSENLTVELSRHGLTGSSTLLADKSTFGSGGAPRSFATAMSHAVDAANYAYFVKVAWKDDPMNAFAVRAVRITYTVTQPLP